MKSLQQIRAINGTKAKAGGGIEEIYCGLMVEPLHQAYFAAARRARSIIPNGHLRHVSYIRRRRRMFMVLTK